MWGKRPSGAPINPSQDTTEVNQLDNQQQMTETYRAQLQSIPHLSPLHGVGNNPPQHDDLFTSSQGFPTPSPDLRRLQGFPTPSPDLGHQGFPAPLPDLGRQGPYMYGGGQQQALLGMRSGGHGSSPGEYQQHYLFRQQKAAPQMNHGPYQHGSHTAYDEQLQNLNSIVAKLVSEVAMLSESNQQIFLINAQHSVTNDALTSQVKMLADQVQTLRTDISESQATTKSQKKSSDGVSGSEQLWRFLFANSSMKPRASSERFRFFARD
ncbi:hypothetical protein F4604DRAFT_2002736 [Suillus subluteus]|nr:hypothetical protein F4604DRAFT_2002736 [Suillus subluteus]